MNITCLAVDKLRFRPYQDAADEYLGRLKHYTRLRENELKPARGNRSEADTRADESQRLLEAVPDGAHLVVLDERGRSFTSVDFSRFLGQHRDLGRSVCFLLGGALGHTDALRARADTLLRLSEMTLPHELARVVLYEQLYRAMTLIKGEPYHK